MELSEAAASLMFQIIDTGVGIAEADLAQLFQVFEQVGDRQRQFEGTASVLPQSTDCAPDGQ